MSIPKALEVGVIGTMDLYTGMAVSGLVEIVAPPITNQSPLMMLLEGTVQFLTILYLSLEGTKIMNRTGDKLASPIPYAVGLYVGMPNTIAKLTAVAGYARQLVKGIVSPAAPATSVPQSLPVGTTAQTPTSAVSSS